ncbi:MAG TPA: hypothetical protein VH643_18160 [Gemmataceae bacterium]|jgi:predicted Zn finger-like uncharacterized protein
MPLQVKCPSCSTVLRLPDTVPPGGAVRCPKCQTVLKVPGSAAASAPKPAASAVKPSVPQKAVPPSRPPAAIKPAAPPAPTKRQVVKEPDANGDDDLPARAKPKSKKGLLFGILGCVGLLFLVCGGGLTFGIYKLVSGAKEVGRQFEEELKKQTTARSTEVAVQNPPGDGGGKQPPENSPDKKPPVNAPDSNPPAGKSLDVAYIPADFNAAFVIHPARVLRSKSPLLPSGETLEAMLGEAVKETGIDLHQLEQAIVLVEPFPGGAPSAAPPGGDLAWKPFASQQGKFSALFPGTPKQTVTKDQKGATTYTFTAEIRSQQTAYVVIYNDMPPGVTEAASKLLFDNITKNFGPDVKKKKDIKLDGHPGIEVELERSQGRDTVAVTDRIYLVDRRMYQVMASATKDKKDPVQFAKFLDSFKLRKPNDPPAPPTPPAPALQPGFDRSVAFSLAGILHFRKPVDGKKILGGMLKELEEARAADKIYYRSKTKEMARVPLAGHVANERTILLAPEPTLKKMLAVRNVNSPLIDRLRKLDLDHDVSGVFVLGPFRLVVAELAKNPNIPPPLAGVKTLDKDLDAATLFLDLNGSKLLEIVLDGTNEASANSLEQLVKAALDMGKQMYGGSKDMFQKEAAKELPPDLAPKLLRAADQLANDGIKVTKRGKQVHVTVDKPKGLDGP